MYDKETYEKLIAVTNRHLCVGDYLEQIRKIVSLHPASLILREKDLTPSEYRELAVSVLQICREGEVPCFLHSHLQIARELGCSRIHLSVPAMREIYRQEGRGVPGSSLEMKNMGTAQFSEMSVSCHSLADVQEAVAAGASRVILGNIFETDCKKGLPGKGLEFLRQICSASPIPVFAIGGITPENLPAVLEAGAAGGCMMSGFMKI